MASSRRALQDVMWKRPCEGLAHQWSAGNVCDECALWLIDSIRAENERLRAALQSISTGVTLVPPSEQTLMVDGFYRGIAQAALATGPGEGE